jgi:hypothetical protein
MRGIRIAAAALLGLVTVSGVEAADELGYKVVSKKATFEDVLDNVKEAIINRGFVIDYVGHFNAMLERTAEATGSITEAGRKSPYQNAQYLQFCPSKLTHEAVSASLFSIANCPIAIFVFEAAYEPGKISVGFRLPVASPSKRVKDVNAKLTSLLTSIASDATK